MVIKKEKFKANVTKMFVDVELFIFTSSPYLIFIDYFILFVL